MKIKVLVIFTLLAVLSVGFSVESLAADKAKAERVDKNAKVCKRLEVPGSHGRWSRALLMHCSLQGRS